jgi:hypothetical protein
VVQKDGDPPNARIIMFHPPLICGPPDPKPKGGVIQVNFSRIRPPAVEPNSGSKACFEVTGRVCAIRAHTKEPCPNDQTLQILFTAFASEGNYPSNTFLLASSLIFEMPIPLLICRYLLHDFFSRKIFSAPAPRKILE